MLHVLETSDMNHGVSKKDLKMECFPTEMMSLLFFLLVDWR